MVTVSNEVKAQWANRTLQRNMQDGLGYITKLLATLELCTVQAVVLGMVLCPEHMMMVMALMNRAWLGLAKLAKRSGAKFELPDLASLEDADVGADAERRGTPRPTPLERDDGEGEEEEKEDVQIAPKVARAREPGPRAKPRRPAPAPSVPARADRVRLSRIGIGGQKGRSSGSVPVQRRVRGSGRSIPAAVSSTMASPWAR